MGMCMAVSAVCGVRRRRGVVLSCTVVALSESPEEVRRSGA